jgi:dTDP-6-deoxy-L-talose 4-dehydrogenase (NAD+)
MIAGGLKDIVVAGTCFEYGMIEGCLSEDLDTKPSNSYGIAKDTLRKFIIELKENFSFQYKWIRIFYVYGEGQSKRSLFYLLDKAIKNKDKQFNMSGGEQLRDYLYISELTKYICLIADQNIYVDKIINCCSGNPRSVKDLVEKYLKEKNYNMSLNLGYYPYRDFEPMAFWGDRTNLENLLKL